VITGPPASLVTIRPEPVHYAGEAVTTAMLALNKLAVRAESFAQGEDLNPQIVWADDDIRPDQA
jgi:hypothetical protein